MLIQERFILNDRELVKSYSDNGVYIKQLETNLEFAEAIDVYPLRFNYVETTKPIEEGERI